MDKMDSNQRRPVEDISPVQSFTGFMHVLKFLMDSQNVNKNGTDTPNVKRIENRHQQISPDFVWFPSVFANPVRCDGGFRDGLVVVIGMVCGGCGVGVCVCVCVCGSSEAEMRQVFAQQGKAVYPHVCLRSRSRTRSRSRPLSIQ